MSTILEQLKQIYQLLTGNEPTTFELDNGFIIDIGMDSIDVVEYFMLVEDKFNVTMLDEEMDEIITVQDLIDFLKNKGIKDE